MVSLQNVFLFPTTKSVFVTFLDMENTTINAKGHPESIISTIRFDENTFEDPERVRILQDIINIKFIINDILTNKSKYAGLSMSSPFNCVLGIYFGEFEVALEEFFGLSNFLYINTQDTREKLILDLFGAGPYWDHREPLLHYTLWVEKAEKTIKSLEKLI